MLKSNNKIDGDKILINALDKLKINLLELIAETSLWASPEAVKMLIEKTGTSTRFPNIRRKRSNEIKGNVVNGIRLDDNTYANSAIKEILGYKGDSKKKIENMYTCHIYDGTCYDEKYHTKIKNLVLIPKAIAQLSDHYNDVKLILKYRSYELYGWFLPEEGIPTKLSNYPNNWKKINSNVIITNELLSSTDIEVKVSVDKEEYFDKVEKEIEKIKRRVPNWFIKGKTQINSIILYTFLELLVDNTFVPRALLEEKCHEKIKDFNGNFNQMAHFGEKNHGKIFDVDNNKVYLWEPIENIILDLYQLHK
jgi:hypothetical protein